MNILYQVNRPLPNTLDRHTLLTINHPQGDYRMKKSVLVLGFVLVCLVGVAWAISLGDMTMYDGSGSPAGRMTSSGYVYNGSGSPAGRIDGNNFYDGSGSPAGRVDGDRFYDGSGSPAGRVESNGYFYNGSGSPAGRIESNGYFYDGSGSPAGRFEGYKSDYMHQAVGWILLLRK